MRCNYSRGRGNACDVRRRSAAQIKKELGLEKDDKEALLTKFTDRLKGLTVPEKAQVQRRPRLPWGP